MKELSLKTLILGLIPCLLIACGDPGDAYTEGEPAFGGQAADVDENGNLVDQAEEVGEVPPFDEEPPVGEEPEPFCGDGLIDEGEQCDDGNDEAGDGCSDECQLEELTRETEGTIELTIVVSDPNSNSQPAEASCTDTIQVVEDAGEIFVNGDCFLPANVIGVAGSGLVEEDGSVEGLITFTLNGRENEVPFTGALAFDALDLEFFGVTLVGGRLEGTWDGIIQAEFE